jgi:hypothetical protein
MARGWESKSVEEMREVDIAPAEPTKHPVTPEDLERARQLETLQLARSRSLNQLRVARSDAQRNLFQRTLEALNEQIRSLGGSIVDRTQPEEAGDQSATASRV